MMMMPPGYNTDTLGVQFTKKRHDLYGIDPTIFEGAVMRLVRVIRSEAGENVVEARLIPEREMWAFYNEWGEVVITVPHDTVDHIWGIMAQPWSPIPSSLAT